MAKKKTTSTASNADTTAKITKITRSSAKLTNAPVIPSTSDTPTNPIDPKTTENTTSLPETTTNLPEIISPSKAPSSKPTSSLSTRSTRSKTMHATDSEPQVTEFEEPSLPTPAKRKKKVAKLVKGPRRAANKGVVIEEPAESDFGEEVHDVTGKGKGKVVMDEEAGIPDEDWDIDSNDGEDVAMGSKKKIGSLKRKRSHIVDSEDDDKGRVTATLATTIDKDRVIDILKSAELSELALSQYIQLCEHHILAGRYYPQQWLQSEKAYEFFLHILKQQRWIGMFSPTSVVFVPEIIQFYQSVAVSSSGEMMSAIVNGKPFMVSVDEIARLFDVPNEGLEPTYSNSWPPLEGVGSLDVLRYFDPLATLQTKILPGNLDGPHQFIFNCIRRTITPRTHTRGHCTIPDLLLIYHLMTGKPVNLASVMVNYIKEVADEVQKDIKATAKGLSKRGAQRKRELPYGMWLTHLMWKKEILPSDGYCVHLEDRMTDGLVGQMHLRIKDDKLIGLHGEGYSGAGSSSGLRAVLTQVKKSGMPPGARAGFSMCVHKKRAVLFGGVVDMEVEGDVMMSLFLNEIYGFQMDNRRWYPLELRKEKSVKDKVKKLAEEKTSSDMDTTDETRTTINDQNGGNELGESICEMSLETENDDSSNSRQISANNGKSHETDTSRESQHIALPEVVKPCGRINACIAVGRDTLYLYGGMMEVKDQEITLDDLYTLNLSKLDEWKCIIPASESEWVEASEDEDEEEEDDDDSEDSGEGSGEETDEEEEDDDDEMEVDENSLKVGDAVALIKGKGKSLRRKEKRARIEQIRASLGLSDSLRTPAPGETLRDFYKRTSTYWQMAAYEHTQHTGKELRKDGFDFAEVRYRELKPLLDELAILEEEQKAEEQQVGESSARKGGNKNRHSSSKR